MDDVHRRVIQYAELIGKNWDVLSSLIESKDCFVHFRPTGDGISLISLLPESPQRGPDRCYKTIESLREAFEDDFMTYCVGNKPERPTPEKQLQSYVIREIYLRKGQQWMCKTEQISSKIFDDIEFVTDEITHPKTGERGDLLAVRKYDNQYTPVVIELKTERIREVALQAKAAAKSIRDHTEFYKKLYSAILDKKIVFGSECQVERWIVWPNLASRKRKLFRDGKEDEMLRNGIGIVQYQESGEGKDQYQFHFGKCPQPVAQP